MGCSACGGDLWLTWRRLGSAACRWLRGDGLCCGQQACLRGGTDASIVLTSASLLICRLRQGTCSCLADMNMSNYQPSKSLQQYSSAQQGYDLALSLAPFSSVRRRSAASSKTSGLRAACHRFSSCHQRETERERATHERQQRAPARAHWHEMSGRVVHSPVEHVARVKGVAGVCALLDSHVVAVYLRDRAAAGVLQPQQSQQRVQS